MLAISTVCVPDLDSVTRDVSVVPCFLANGVVVDGGCVKHQSACGCAAGWRQR